MQTFASPPVYTLANLCKYPIFTLPVPSGSHSRKTAISCFGDIPHSCPGIVNTKLKHLSKSTTKVKQHQSQNLRSFWLTQRTYYWWYSSVGKRKSALYVNVPLHAARYSYWTPKQKLRCILSIYNSHTYACLPD